MGDGRSNRKNKVVAFVSGLQKDRDANLATLISTAKALALDGFENVDWTDSTWKITSGRLLNVTGRSAESVALNFNYSPKLGSQVLVGKWSSLAKSLLILRCHRRNQSVTNQRLFITAVGYIAHSSNNFNLALQDLTSEVLDLACETIMSHYSKSVAYNLHKAVAEVARHCDANGLCRATLSYKYSKMSRPENVGGLNHKRLDDKSVLETESEKLVAPALYKVIGDLYQYVPMGHKYRFYVLLLTLLCCLGRRFSEVALLPNQSIKTDTDGREYLEYFPRKVAAGDAFTPKRKLYMPTDVLPIVKSVIEELRDICRPARETAEEVFLKQGPDIRFLEETSCKKKLYKEDLTRLGISPVVLDINGRVRKSGHAEPDYEKLTQQGRKPRNPFYFTYKAGLIALCQMDYSHKLNAVIHVDQLGKKYYLKDLLLVKHMGLSSGFYAHWLSSPCTHSMMTTFLRYFPNLALEYASSSISVDFTSHHFRHTLNTLLDEGGLSDILQTEWFGRSNLKDTKAYQHTSREKRALMLREDIKSGRAGGKLAEVVANAPIEVQDAILNARIKAVHDVGAGVCVHNFSQLPCERHLQCSANCDDYVWAKEDKGRLDELKRQLALTTVARATALAHMDTQKPKKSAVWLIHNEKKIKTLTAQLNDQGVRDFNTSDYIKELDDGDEIQANK